SERNTPEQVVEVLNIYLHRFSDAIMNHNGYINKFLGDGLMALFGATVDIGDHADCAVRSALECIEINNELAPKYHLNVRIGVNSGPLIWGSMGSTKKLEYTAIGDTVNLASRLEGANKFFNTKILIGDNTKKLLQEQYPLNYLGKFSVKGKDIPIGVYYYSMEEQIKMEKFTELITAYEGKDEVKFKEILNYFKTNKLNFGPINFYLRSYLDKSSPFGSPIKLTEK
ncbi:MAG: adenylate/guanylate cyclase domain-containing protein, partial [Spirochaetes bacterium]|nr:adenylate/guanylate cyclase domain-containing protein [Spirochaetota bacterium]